MGGQERGVAPALGPGVGEAVEVVRRPGSDPLGDPPADPPFEAGRVVGPDPHVLVHVEHHHVPQGTSRDGSTSSSTKASWELPVANMACAVPARSTVRRRTAAASSAAAEARADGPSVTTTSAPPLSGAPGRCMEDCRGCDGFAAAL